MSPTKIAELKVQLEHAAQVTRRLRLPDRQERIVGIAVAATLAIGFACAVTVLVLVMGAR